MTNEDFIRMTMTTRELAGLLLSYTIRPDFDYNFDDEPIYICDIDVWTTTDGYNFDSYDEAVEHEIGWLSKKSNRMLDATSDQTELSEKIERLTTHDGDYCRDVCGGMKTCKRFSSGEKKCSDAYRYERLQEFEDIGISPKQMIRLINSVRGVCVGKNECA